MRRNPDDEALLSRIEVTLDKDPTDFRGSGRKIWAACAYIGNEYLGEFDFRVGRSFAYSRNVWIQQPYRRRGVASLLYRWVENRLGLKVVHSKDQTTDGKAFAKGRRRNPVMNMRDITKISISILHAEPKGSEWRRVRSAKGVNNGACDLWATVAQEKYGGEIVFFDRADRRSEWEQYDRPPHGWGHGSAGTAHCAVLLGGRYYDAENPTGVESVADLNYMKRW